MSFKERLKFGKEGEAAVEKILIENDVTYERTDSYSYWDPKFDKEHGDFHIATPWGTKKIEADVKRAGISFDSIDSFKGQVFILMDREMNYITVFPAAAMKKYKQTCLKNGSGYEQLSSGDWGIKFHAGRIVHLELGIPLEKWIENGCRWK